MRRTIKMASHRNRIGWVFYRGKSIDYILYDMRRHFGLEDGCKYRVTITEGSKYSFVLSTTEDGYYKLYYGNKFIDYICEEHFSKVFFKPDLNKRYNITVNEVR